MTSLAARRVATLRIAAPRPRSLASPALVAAAVVAGSAGVLATSPLGSGDYGQWLMTARPYLGEAVPTYRAATAVPPVVPFLTSIIGRFVGDGTAMIHVSAVLILLGLATAVFVTTAALFRSRLAAAVAVAATFLLTDQVFELFAFGGLLQAGSLIFLLLTVAAYGSLIRDGSRAAGRSALVRSLGGAAAILLGAVTHVGTAAILVPAGIGLAALAWWRVGRPASALGARGGSARLGRRGRPRWTVRWAIAISLLIALAIAGAVWVVALLPGGTELARNPASLAYRGPERLLAAINDSWTGTVVIVVGGVGIALGTVAELRRGRPAGWTALATWLAVTLAVVAASIVGSASTDYPRFATPILVPLCVATGGAGGLLLARFGAVLEARRPARLRASRRAWAVGLAAIASSRRRRGASRPSRPRSAAMPYGCVRAGAAGRLIRTDVPPGTTILAPFARPSGSRD